MKSFLFQFMWKNTKNWGIHQKNGVSSLKIIRYVIIKVNKFSTFLDSAGEINNNFLLVIFKFSHEYLTN